METINLKEYNELLGESLYYTEDEAVILYKDYSIAYPRVSWFLIYLGEDRFRVVNGTEYDEIINDLPSIPKEVQERVNLKLKQIFQNIEKTRNLN